MTAFVWEVLEQLSDSATKEKIESAELKWITQLKPKYNRSLSVNRHCLGRKTKPRSEETKAKIRAKVVGYKHSDETNRQVNKQERKVRTRV